MPELTLVEAVRAALGRAMEEDPNVIIFGEDVGIDGGVFRATDGLVVPNAVIANAKIINESGGPWVKHRIRVPVGVAYGSDVDEVCSILEKTAKDLPEVVKLPAPRVRMRAFGADRKSVV